MMPPKKDSKSAPLPTSGTVETEQRLNQALDSGSGQSPPAEEGLPTEPPCRRSRAEEDGHQSTQVDSIPF